MDENITNEITESTTGLDSGTFENDAEVLSSGDSSDTLESGNNLETVSTGDSNAGTVDTELVYSVLSDVGLVDSSGNVSTYSETEQQADSELYGAVTELNATLTLVLFFLLFQWIDKKVQAITRGMTNE